MALIPLQYQLDGPKHAPVVLLVPPFGTKMSVWEPQMPELTRNRQVLRVNHRGHGFSPAPEGPYSVEDLALDILGVLEERGFSRVSAVGAGFGGSLLLWIAANSPEPWSGSRCWPGPRAPRPCTAGTGSQPGCGERGWTRSPRTWSCPGSPRT